MAKNPPACQFYWADFLTSTADMPPENVGAYMRLLGHQWINGSIPADHTRMARIAGVPLKQFKQMWSELSQKFLMEEDGTCRNVRLELERQKQIAYRESQAQHGRDGAKARWHPNVSNVKF